MAVGVLRQLACRGALSLLGAPVAASRCVSTLRSLRALERSAPRCELAAAAAPAWSGEQRQPVVFSLLGLGGRSQGPAAGPLIVSPLPGRTLSALATTPPVVAAAAAAAAAKTARKPPAPASVAKRAPMPAAKAASAKAAAARTKTVRAAAAAKGRAPRAAASARKPRAKSPAITKAAAAAKVKRSVAAVKRQAAAKLKRELEKAKAKLKAVLQRERDRTKALKEAERNAKAVARAQAAAAKAKAKAARRRAPSAYNLFAKEVFSSLPKPVGPGVTQEVMKTIPARFKALSDAERQKFVDAAAAAKAKLTAERLESKAPQPSKRAPSPYLLYVKDVYGKVRADHPNARATELTALIGRDWRELSDADRKKYEAKAEAARKAKALEADAPRKAAAPPPTGKVAQAQQ